ncbi:flagellar hook-length control protein FliK [Fuchsiella alkaliacetigena]|uniref:flagellar hook-length control protein FliK n=1 Tax=Fuchsiella alkaliacetigena TaxID=957042 RepID=UPI00200B7EE8|nr:flagellar hook-length control protein FliK [Fuchsiella alkaliacetigena]MCK8823871.1 flagellar hook-length control protein FliK [Fuchsiella alkaliacetigena]
MKIPDQPFEVKKDLNSNSQFKEELNSQNSNDILAKLELPTTESNQKIVESLLQYQLPISKKLITELQNLISTEKDLSLLLKSMLLLKKANLEINKSNLQLLNNFLSNKENINTDLLENISPEKLKQIITNPQLKKELSSQSISDILAKLELPTTESNQKIVESLLQYQLPISKKLITELQNLISTEKDLSLLLKSIIFLKKADLNINQASIDLLANFLNEKPDLAADLTELINNSPPKTAEQLNSFILKTNQGSNSFTAHQLKSTILNLGLNLERDILMNNQFNNNSKLKSLLMSLKSSSQQLPSKTIDNLINNLTKQQLIMHNKGNDDKTFLYLQLPIQFNQQVNTGHLIIYRRRHQKSEQATKNNSFKLILQLETDNLGLMNIKLDFHQQKLNLDIKAASKDTLNLIKNSIDSLKIKIESWDFQIQKLDYSILKNDQDNFNLEDQILEPNPSDLDSILHQIDIKI